MSSTNELEPIQIVNVEKRSEKEQLDWKFIVMPD